MANLYNTRYLMSKKILKKITPDFSATHPRLAISV
jgi:hypothetical protein